MKGLETRKSIFIVVMVISLISGLVFWLVQPDVTYDLKEILMIVAVALLAIFALVIAFRRLWDAKRQLPVEDELSKVLKRRGASTSYYVSLYMWLGIMMLEARIPLERHTLIGAGILGMAIIYALSWSYHRYLTRVQ